MFEQEIIKKKDIHTWVKIVLSTPVREFWLNIYEIFLKKDEHLVGSWETQNQESSTKTAVS